MLILTRRAGVTGALSFRTWLGLRPWYIFRCTSATSLALWSARGTGISRTNRSAHTSRPYKNTVSLPA
jgi:hypothetical protein